MVKRYALLFSVIVTTLTCKVYAQESIMSDVSYVQLEKLIATAKENYPRLKGLEAQVSSARTGVSREQVSWLDAFSVSYVYNPNNTIDRVDPVLFTGYQVAFNVNLGSLLQKPSNVKQAKQAVQTAQHNLDEYHLTLETEVKRRYFSYIQAMNVLKVQSKLTEEALAVSKDVKGRYEKSETTFEQFSISQITYSNAVMSKMNAETNFLTAKASLEELITKRIEEVL